MTYPSDPVFDGTSPHVMAADHEAKPLNELLDEIEQYCEAATRGPWIAEGSQIARRLGNERNVNDHMIVRDAGMWRENETFIARARTDLPRLVKELRECLKWANRRGCSYCDYQIVFDSVEECRTPEGVKRMSEHVLTCPKRPEATLFKKIAELEASLAESAANERALALKLVITKEELIKKVKERVDKLGHDGISEANWHELTALPSELEKVELNV